VAILVILENLVFQVEVAQVFQVILAQVFQAILVSLATRDFLVLVVLSL